MITGAIFVSVLGTLLHFAYGLSGNNVIVGLFTPINESTWEHMKLIFFPMLIFSLYARIMLKSNYPCINSALAVGTLIGTFLIPVLFYTYSGILGYNVTVIDILTFYISVISAFYIAYKLTVSCKMDRYKILLNILLLVLAAAFVIFTLSPPDIALFINP